MDTQQNGYDCYALYTRVFRTSCAVDRMLALVLIGGVVLVEQIFHVALSFALHPVGVSTLQAVCDTVRAVFAIATDEWTTVTLLTEQFQNAEH